MFSYIIPFIILLGVLVFIHELGHFLVARLFGVGVTTFSLGFGPKIFKRKIGETEYCVSLIPLGGYVKMVGEDPLEEIEEDLAKVSFSHKPLWQRALVVAAGPGFNFIMAFFIFIFIFTVGYPRLQPIVGKVMPGTPAERSGLFPGDTIKAINGKPIASWEKMEKMISKGDGSPMDFTLSRKNQRMDMTITPVRAMSQDIFGNPAESWSIGISSSYRMPITGISDPGSIAGQAGFKTGDRIAKVDGQETPTLYQFKSALAARPGRTVDVEFWREKEGVEEATDESAYDQITLSLPVPADVTEKTVLTSLGIDLPDLFILEVLEGGIAQQAGFQGGDKILKVGDESVTEQSQFLNFIRVNAEKEVNVTVMRGGEEIVLTVTPELARRETEKGDAVQSGRIGVLIGYSEARGIMAPERHKNPFTLVGVAASETVNWTVITAKAFYYILTGTISPKSVGGPIRIAKMAGDSAKAGLIQYIFLMAVLSLNLGVINLVPIPVFDGGHLLLFSLEGIKGKPLQMKTLQVASYMGLAVILLLIGFLFYNDIAYLFPGLRGNLPQ